MALASGWRIDPSSDKELIFSGEYERIRMKCDARLRRAVLAAIGSSNAPAAVPAHATPALAFLAEKGVLIGKVDSDPRHGRTAQYVTSVSGRAGALDDIRSSRMGIIGVGGTGSIALQHFVGVGIERFVLIDHDTVEASNLNRQYLFERDDFQASKVAAAKAWVESRCVKPGVDCFSLQIRPGITDGELRRILAPVDAAFVAADSPWPQTPLNVIAALEDMGIPCIFSSVGVQKALVTPVFTGTAASVRSAATLVHDVRSRPQSPLTASHGVTNALVATMAVDRLLAHLGGYLPESGYHDCLVVDLRVPGAPTTTPTARVWI